MSAIPGSNPANVGVTGGGPLQGGGLNFGSVPSPTDYMGAYRNALSLNQQNYGNILSGYQQTAGRQQTAQQAIEGGYGNLYNTVQGTIQGIGASQAQAIRDAYAQQSGTSAQQLINSGLGNTTVQQSVQRGNLLDEQKAQIGLANQMAQLQAGYQSNLGLAGLNYANQANMQNTALSGQQLNWMNSVNSPYPNAAAYNQLALQQGYANKANQLYGQIPRGGAGPYGGGGGGVSGLGGGMGLKGLPGQDTGYGSTLGGGGGGGGGGQTYNLPNTRENSGIVNPSMFGSFQQGGGMGVDLYGGGLDMYGNPLGGSIAGQTQLGNLPQASLGRPGIENSLYTADGAPKAGVAGVAGQTWAQTQAAQQAAQQQQQQTIGGQDWQQASIEGDGYSSSQIGDQAYAGYSGGYSY